MKKFIFSFAAVFALLFFSKNLNAQSVFQAKPVVNSISAKKTAINKILLSWSLPENFSAASIAVFRSSEQIIENSTILSMKPVAEIPSKSTSYTDTLKFFGEYYYALIARDKSGNLFDIVIPSANATISAVKLENPKENEFEKTRTGQADDIGQTGNIEQSEEKYQPSFLRNLPLPYLNLISDIGRKPTEFDEKAKSAGKALSGKFFAQKPKLREPYIFEEDLICAPGGDDYYLFQSLKTYFIKKDYRASAADLKKFLSVNREPYTAARASFYLAESQYYCRNYKSALQIFLFLEDVFPSLSKLWADSSLDQYAIPPQTDN